MFPSFLLVLYGLSVQSSVRVKCSFVLHASPSTRYGRSAASWHVRLWNSIKTWTVRPWLCWRDLARTQKVKLEKKKASLELPDPFCVAWPADLTGLSSQLDYRVNTARVTDRWARQEESPRSPWQGLHAVNCSLVVEIAACALCAHGDNRDLCMRRIRLCWPT